MGSSWYYARMGSANPYRVGPVSWQELWTIAQSGQLTGADLLWHPTFPDWVRAETVSGLLPAPPVPVAPAADGPPLLVAAGMPQSASPRRRWPLWVIPLVVVVLAGAGLGVYFGVYYGAGTPDESAATGQSMPVPVSVSPTTSTSVIQTTSTASTTSSTITTTTTTEAPDDSPGEGDRKDAVVVQLEVPIKDGQLGEWVALVEFDDGSTTKASIDLPDGTSIGGGTKCTVECREGQWVVVAVK
jgi:hypothetical protein